MRIGITGHQKLHEPANWEWVRKELDRLLPTFPQPLIGISSLAVGADQLFATAVLERGGTLEIIVPFAEYETTFAERWDRQEYARLLQGAMKVTVLETRGTNEEAYLASGKTMVDRSDLIIAVWNGKPAAGLGGTGDIVEYAIGQQKRTIQIDPIRRNVAELIRADPG